MTILYYSNADPAEPWREAFARELPRIPFRVWPDPGPLESVRYALVWKPPQGFLAQFPNLKAILALGAGVDPIPSDPTLPKGVPLLRLVDVGFPAQMADYATYAVLRFQRRMREIEALQRQARWNQIDPFFTRDFPVGVMGLGVIGSVVALRVAAAGYAVAGWARSPKQLPGVEVFSGSGTFKKFLSRSRVVVNALPLTPKTESILDAAAFASMPRGGYVVNIGRGAHLVDQDLIAALDSGQLDGAMLDVFREEPLPSSHPFWGHPKIVVTPHVAAPTIASEVQAQVIENIRRLERGESPVGLVDRDRGY
ncbi:MAG TPA: glyoxylate/hydroxypyruvate reductase A [Burkholderiales bacterium]|nr:glyoxylate/hydroxypyruvate reductase A [Burkholderiales bacterium]